MSRNISNERYDNDDYDQLTAKFITREKMDSIQERKKVKWAGALVAPVDDPSLRVSIPIPPLIIPKFSVYNVMGNKHEIELEPKIECETSSLSSISAIDISIR